MGLKNKLLFGTLLFLFISFHSAAQNGEAQPLTKILPALELKFDVVFTYLDSDLEGILIIAPPNDYSLDRTIKYLQHRAKLKFNQLSSRFITIKLLSPTSINLCGYIKDNSSKEALSDVLVMAGRHIAISNSEGYFSLENVSPSEVLTIRLLAYETKNINADAIDKNCPDILLWQATTIMEQVVITDYITQGINKKSGGAFEMNTSKMGILPGLTEPDVLYTIQNLPGIHSVSETVSDINVRGGTHDQNLILWDGVRMFQPSHFFGLISVFNPYFTDKVTFIKNGSAADLGDAVSSTIDIRTDNRVAEKFTGAVGFNLINGDLLLKIPLSKKTSIHLSGRRSYADIFRTPTFNSYFDRVFRDTDVLKSSTTLDEIEVKNDFYFTDTNIKFLYDISKRDKLRISFTDIHNEVSYQENELLNGTLVSRTSGLHQKSIVTGLNYSRLWNDKVKSTALAYFSTYELKSTNFDIINEQRLIQENEVLDIGLKFDTRINLNNNFDLYTGYQFSNLGIENVEDLNNPSVKRSVKEVLNTHVLFAESSFENDNGRTHARLGMRATYFEKFGKLIIEPRFSLSHQLSKRFTLELLGEMKNQSATQTIDFQTDFLGIEKRRWSLANDADIPIIQSTQISLGISYQYHDWLISIEGYGKEVMGVSTASQGFQNQFEFVKSVGEYDAYGLDFFLNRKVKNLSAWISYSYALNSYDIEGFLPPEFPNNIDIRHTFSLGINYEWKSLEFSSGLNLRTGKPYTKPIFSAPLVNEKINYGTPNSYRIDNYMRLDASIRYKFEISKMPAQLGFSVWNVLDRNNVINEYYQINKAGELKEVEQSSLGFTPNFNFRINF